MNGKLEVHCTVNPIMLYMLEVRAVVSQSYQGEEFLNTTQTDPIKNISLMMPFTEGGFELRVLKIRETAEDLENEILDHYNYAWNVRGNGGLRRILP